MISLNIGQLSKERMDGSVGNVKNTTCITKVLIPEETTLDKGLGELIVAGKGLYFTTFSAPKTSYLFLKSIRLQYIP